MEYQVCVKCNKNKEISLFPKEKRKDTFYYRKTCKKCRCNEKILLIDVSKPDTKKCSKCGEIKLIENFNKSYSGKFGYDNRCKVCKKEGTLKFKNNSNYNKLKKVGEDYLKKCTKCKKIKNINEYYVNNRTIDNLSCHCKECILNYTHELENVLRKYRNRRKRIKNDYGFRLRCNMSASIVHYLKGEGKSRKSLELLGVSDIEFYKTYLESNFGEEFSWEGYGKEWQIDHIIPVNVFDLSKSEHQLVAFNYLNTRPLNKLTNLTRSKNVTQEDIDIVVHKGLSINNEVMEYLITKIGR